MVNDVAHLARNHLAQAQSQKPFPERWEAAPGGFNGCSDPSSGVCRLCMLAASQVRASACQLCSAQKQVPTGSSFRVLTPQFLACRPLQ